MRDSRALRNTLSDSLEVEPLTQMHLNATGRGVRENGRKKDREVK